MAGVELGLGYVNLVPSAKGFTEKIKEELGAPLSDTGKDAGDKAGSGFLGAFSGHMKAVAGIAAGALGAIGVGGGLLKIGESFDSAFDSIRVGTGATGAALEGLQQDFRNVVANVPTDFESAGTAIADLNTRLGLTGQPLSDISAQMLNLSRITDTDLGTNIESVTRLMGDWGISADDMSGKLDEVFRASQATGPSVDTLSQLMTQFGGPMRQLGFNFEETAALLGKFEKEGVNTNLVMGSMRIALGKMAQAGEKDVPGALRAAVKSIQEAGTAGEANSKALELFGAKAGPDMAAAIREGRFNIDELVDTIANGSETIATASDDTADFAERWQLFKNRVMVALEPLAGKVFGALGAAMDRLGPIAEGIANKAGPVLSALGDKVTLAFSAMKSAFSGEGITSNGLIGFFERVGVIARDVFTELVGGFRAFAAAFKAGDGDVTSSGFPGFMERVANLARQVFDALRQIDWGAVFSQAVAFISPVVEAVGTLVAKVVDFAQAALPVLISNIQAVLPTVLSVASTLRDILAKAVDVARVAIGFLSDHAKIAVPVLLGLAGAFGAFKAVQGTTKFIKDTTKEVKDLYGSIKTGVGQVRSFASSFASGVKTVASFGKQALTTAINVGRQTAAFIAQKAAALAAAAAQKVMAAAQWALNAAMSANPITLIVIGIAALVAGFVLAYKKIKPFHDAVDAVGRAFATAAGAILDGAKAVFNWLKDNWPLLLPILLGPLGIVAALIITFWDQIKGAATAAARWIGDRISDIVGFFTGLASSIGGAVAGAVTWLVQTGIDIVQGLWDGIQSLWGTVTGFFTGIAGAVIDWVAGAVGWLVQTGIDIVTGLITGYLSIWGTVIDFFTSIGGKVIGWLADAATWLVDKGKDIIQGLIDGYLSMVGTVTSFFTGLAGQVLGWVGNAASWLVDKGKDIIRGAINGVSSMMSELSGWFTGLAGKVAGWVGDLGSALWDAGVDLIKGFIGGIGSMFGAVKDKLGDLTGKLTSWKGPPAKDAKILFGAGQLIMQGLQAGIESQTGALRAQLAGVTDMIGGTGGTVGVNGVATVTPVRAVAASLPVDATGAAGAGQVINVNLSGSNVWGDAKSAARQLNEELRKLQRGIA